MTNSFIKKVEEVCGMANVPQRVYQLPLAQDIKFNVLQPGDKRIGHALRVKVFRRSPETGPNFSIRLSKDPLKIKVETGEVFVSKSDLKLILDHLKKYREAYLKLWHDDGMDIDDLKDEMAKIDNQGA